MKILIIGGYGFIGSGLYQFLSKLGHEVQSCDAGYFGTPDVVKDNWTTDFDNLSSADIEDFDSIILLAGNSSVSMSKNFSDTYNQNVTKFINLVKKMSPKTRLLYASSCSVYGPLKLSNQFFIEEDGLGECSNPYDATKQILDIVANQLCPQLGISYTAMRFGTVCGTSPNMRWDLLANSMMWSARVQDKVQISNERCKRAVLTTTDLQESILGILNNPVPFHNRPVNLYSFNTTIGEIGALIAKVTGVEIEYNESPNSYSHRLTTVFDDYHFKKYTWEDQHELILDLGRLEFPPDRSLFVREKRIGA